MSEKFLENNRVVHAAPVALLAVGSDMWNGAGAAVLNCEVMSLKNADGAVFIIPISEGATGTASVRICACDDVTPTTTVAVSFPIIL